MSDLWLSPAEIYELTAKKRWTAQCRVLATKGVPFEANAIGRPLVLKSLYLRHTTGTERKARDPNWRAMRGKAA